MRLEDRQGRIKLWIGPRAVPARSAQNHARVPGKPERPGAVGAAASRDVSRSGEPGADLEVRAVAEFFSDGSGGLRLNSHPYEDWYP